MGRWIEGPLGVRFWSRVDREQLVTKCWPWIGSVSVHGYGQFFVFGKNFPAHRMAYELIVGAVPADRHLHHLCGNKICVNPAHLEILSPSEHMAISASNGDRCPAGHEYTPDNIYLRKGRRGVSVRLCRTCHKARVARYRERKRQERQPVT